MPFTRACAQCGGKNRVAGQTSRHYRALRKVQGVAASGCRTCCGRRPVASRPPIRNGRQPFSRNTWVTSKLKSFSVPATTNACPIRISFRRTFIRLENALHQPVHRNAPSGASTFSADSKISICGITPWRGLIKFCMGHALQGHVGPI